MANDPITAALQKIPYGVHIVTSLKDGDELTTRSQDWVSASTISWVMQVSLEPNLIAVAVQKDANLSETIQRSQNFCVHLLGEGDRALIDDFDGPADFTDEQVNGLKFEKGQTGAPILDRGVGYLECKLADAHTLEGDHMLFIGEVVAARAAEGAALQLEDTQYEYGG